MNVLSQIRLLIDRIEMGYKTEPITKETLRRWADELEQEEKDRVENEDWDEGDDWERIEVRHG